MALTAPLLWLDGSLVASETATLPIMAHAPQRGSLVFDVGSFHPTDRGSALFRVREHVARFLRSARIVGLEVEHDEAALVRAAVEVVAATKKDEGLIRWSAFYAASEPDLLPRSARARVAVAAQLLQDPPRLTPLRIATYEDARKAPPSVLSPEAKAAAAYLGPMIARRRAALEGADDVVLLDDEGNIAEAPVANAFAVVGGALVTPPLGKILPGITRDAVLAIAVAEGIEVRETELARSAFVSADEAFLTATSFPIAPIGRIDARDLPSAPGPVTKRLMDRFDRAQRNRDPAFASWCLAVS